ncbi:hypothetical protein KEJ26_02900 [Candidatus Bathyarchaeota archaeon]|nr:hypothetical protein [Candidatus Bathyarchaeota archaeon]
MPARKIRVDIHDHDGNHFSISLEGHVTREKVLQILDLVELLGGAPITVSESRRKLPQELTKFEKVIEVIERRFPVGWFSSRDVQTAYEELYKTGLSLSTSSTYLSRLVSKGILLHTRSSTGWRYKLKRDLNIQSTTYSSSYLQP